jgi:AraC-like DNA-binding protein
MVSRQHKRGCSEGKLGSAQLRAAIDLAHERLADGISLDELLQRPVNRSSVCPMFKATTGMAPHQFVLRCGSERAQRLLVRTDRAWRKSRLPVVLRPGASHQRFRKLWAHTRASLPPLCSSRMIFQAPEAGAVHLPVISHAAQPPKMRKQMMIRTATRLTAAFTGLLFSSSALASDFSTQRVEFLSGEDVVVGTLYVPAEVNAPTPAVLVEGRRPTTATWYPQLTRRSLLQLASWL